MSNEVLVDLTGTERAALMDRLQSSYAFGKTPPARKQELEGIITKLQKEQCLLFSDGERHHIETFVTDYLRNQEPDNPILKSLKAKFVGVITPFPGK